MQCVGGLVLVLRDQVEPVTSSLDALYAPRIMPRCSLDTAQRRGLAFTSRLRHLRDRSERLPGELQCIRII